MSIIDKLKETLANHIEASLGVQGFHWNIEGQDFNQFHDFFSDVYSGIYSEVDRLAEYVRIVSSGSEYVNSVVDITKTNKTLSISIIVGDKPVQMCKEIININNALLQNVSDLFDMASKENEQGLANYCADRIDYHKKLNWKLISITKNTGK